MIKNQDFVIVGLQPWYTSIGSNCKHMARQIAKNNRVLYINSPIDRNTAANKNNDENIKQHLNIIKSGKTQIEEVEKNIYVYYPLNVLESINWLPFTFLFNIFNKRNNRLLADDIAKATSQLGFKDYILFNDNEVFRAIFLKQFLNPKLYIYYSRDYLLGVDYWKKHGQKLEPLHIKTADLAVANSLYLRDYLAGYNNNAKYIGQGCDTTQFNGKLNYEIPDDLKGIRKPVIGYVGALNTLRLDLDCIKNIALKKPDWQIVLVGPEDDVFKKSDLHHLKNVHFIGKKPLNELQNYISGFDVCINPQVVNKVTIGNYPLKVDEYLNMGKPVVATKTNAMSIFEPYVYLAEKPSQYVDLIEKALQEDSKEKQLTRINFASKHTWENCINELYNAITETLAKK